MSESTPSSLLARRFTRRLLRLAALAAALLLSPGLALADEPASPEMVEFFEQQVRPVLARHCWSCHGAEKAEAGLRLDSRVAAMAGGDGGKVIEPGQPEQSRLVRVTQYDGQVQMPPEGKLPDEALAALTRWIELGAPWPGGENVAAVTARSPTDPEAIRQARDAHWAFRPVRLPELPAVSDADWSGTAVDRFIFAKLAAAGLPPSPPADRRTLLRRASYDLTGLPPSPEELAAYEKDEAEGAFARAVERLLASPRYGERWARHWLDVARYADTKGYVFMEERKYPFAYTYRDYVIRAFNDDLPYDRFLTEQIAADLLPQGEDKRSLAALGFLTLGRRFLNNPHDIIDDRIDTLMRGTQGLSAACARCHDHKFDPIPTQDYYSLYGVFASSMEPPELPVIGGDAAMPESLVRAMALVDRTEPVEPVVFQRGNPRNQGEPTPRRFLAVLSPNERRPFTQGSGRLELARCIASKENPLTARVFVNRAWLHHFGAGLVRTPSDFGLRGESPTHPELLDYLAWQFMEHGWSIKWLHREIVLSRTYRQASALRADAFAQDPENRLWWRANLRRLEFESLRDSLLMAAGRLDVTAGGPSVELTTAPFATRRAVYGFIERQNLPGVFRTFDFANPDSSSPQRFATTIPQQTLFMINSPFVVEQAQAAAQRTAAATPAERVGRLYHDVLGRDPNGDELAAARAYVEQESAAPAARLDPWGKLAQILLMSNEFAFVD